MLAWVIAVAIAAQPAIEPPPTLLPVAPPAPAAPPMTGVPRRYPLGDIADRGEIRQRSSAILRGPDWSDYNIYPAHARHLEQEGAVRFWLLLDDGGAPVACGIAQSSYFAELDDGTCDLAMQMRFRPALDESGGARPSVYRARVSWILADPMPMAPGRLSVDIAMAGGRVADCKAAVQGAVPRTWVQSACRMIAGDPGHFLGRAADRAARATVSITLRPAGDDTIWPAPAGRLVATRRTEFVLAGNGDPQACQAVRNTGFGPRSFDYSGPCGLFLSQAWLAPSSDGANEAAVEIDVHAEP